MLKLSYPKFWRRRGFLAYCLWVFSLLYALLGWLRNLSATPISLPAKVICIGNITAGGTGKTQMALWLTKLFKSQNIKSVIITKAYKAKLEYAALVSQDSDVELVGDESMMLARESIVIAAKKIAYALPILQSLKAEIVIIDDGMQNPYFTKDFTILMIDGLRGIGNNFLIPAGPLRQSLSDALDVVDAAIIVEPSIIGENLEPLIKLSNKPVLHAQNIQAIDLNMQLAYFTFCGIGNPDRFLLTLKNTGINLVGFKIFPDHHEYSDVDCKQLQQEAKKLGATLITTSKDYVKISDRLPCIDFKVELFINNQKMLEELIYEKVIKNQVYHNIVPLLN